MMRGMSGVKAVEFIFRHSTESRMRMHFFSGTQKRRNAVFELFKLFQIIKILRRYKNSGGANTVWRLPVQQFWQQQGTKKWSERKAKYKHPCRIAIHIFFDGQSHVKTDLTKRPISCFLIPKSY